MTNIDIFNETMSLIKSNRKLNKATSAAVQSTTVYPESTISHKQPRYSSNIYFVENLTLISAERLAAKGGRTAALNFANPVEPGGGVLRGANAQEEYLCRASGLYPCLISPRARSYYEHHRKLLEQNHSIFWSSDRVIYSKSIPVFRKDIGYSAGVPDCDIIQQYTEDWYSIDVLTCAAPYIRNIPSPFPAEELKKVLESRIKNIFEVAIENDVQSLVLGAFGCGAFRNPPAIVASAFSDVLLEPRYISAFKEVVFAVKRTGTFCENIEAFELAFLNFPPTGEYVFSRERNKRRFFE